MRKPVQIVPSRTRIAIVDDDPVILGTLTDYFEHAGYRVESTGTAAGLRGMMFPEPPDLILLDIHLPDGDGLTLMREIASRHATPVILVTSMGEEADRVIGLELGADDYITKPFSPREVMARVHSVLRRTRSADVAPERTIKTFDGWRFDLDGHRLTSPDGEDLRLTHAEFDLLAALVQNAGRIMRRSALLDAMSGRELEPNERTIDVLVRRLRQKIEPDPATPRYIVTEYGLGYVFTERVT
ncbi:response regulator [Rhodospirillum sp. A1_3_36]|uniref:response regulator n=1 Tax=Rhodospirillum sp. A1_3_36 TaxID=3391666 RepID=UPI0039A439E6